MRDPMPVTAGSRTESNDSILEIVWRQRALVGISIAACTVLALLYLLVATRYYTGYARLYVEQMAPQILPGQHESRAMVQEPETFLYTQREIVSSTPVVAMTLSTPGIRELKTFSGEDNTFSFFKNSLTVDVGKKDQLVAIEFYTPYKEEAAKIVSALVDAYTSYQSKQRFSSTSGQLTQAKTERENLIKDLKAKQTELHAFRAANGMLSSGNDDKSNVVKQHLDSLSKALTDAQLEVISAKTAWDDVNRTVLSTPARREKFEQFRSGTIAYKAFNAIDDQQLRTMMLQAESNLQVLSQRYLSGHPHIKNMQEHLDKLNVQYAAAVYRRMEMAQGKLKDLQTSFDDQQKTAIAQSSRLVEEAQLASDVTRLQKLADDLDSQIRQATLAQTGGAPNITVLEPPTVSRKPTKPYILRTLALAMLAGAVLGCGGAMVRDWYDYRLRSADEIKAALGVTVLGLIPTVDDESSPIARGQKIHIDPASEAAEAYRSLRTAIYFGTKEGQARTILITSPERGDGKSTCTSNLAISIAQASRKVLLIDADMRAPMQDLIFSMNGRVGLGNVLQGRDTIENAIRHTGIENLDLLPAGVAGRNPSELLNSQRFLDLLDLLAEKYDHVIIDSPPLLAVTDARIIAASTDATVLVLRAGKSNRKLSELSIDGLFSVGAKLLGAVVNDVKTRSYRYYGNYGRYGYGDNDRGAQMVLEDDRDVAVRDEFAANGNGKTPPRREAV